MKFCDFSSKNIIVTGASSGLGRATCILLSKLGANVCLIARNKIELDKTYSLMEGSNHIIVPFDLSNIEEYKNIFLQIVEKIGKINGLAHFAGIRKTMPALTFRHNSLLEMTTIHLTSFLELVKQFCKKKIYSQEGASIIVASSVAALKGIKGLSSYGATKAAVDSAVRSIAVELASKKIRINSIAPGHVQTEMNLEVEKTLSVEAFEEIVKCHPLGLGKPDDVANLAAFLLSDRSNWITGTTIPVDGGFSVQ